jgi:hypothetical protein
MQLSGPWMMIGGSAGREVCSGLGDRTKSGWGDMEGRTKIGCGGGGGKMMGGGIGGGGSSWYPYRLSGEGVIDLDLYSLLRLGQRHGLGLRLRLRLWVRLREGLT